MPNNQLRAGNRGSKYIHNIICSTLSCRRKRKRLSGCGGGSGDVGGSRSGSGDGGCSRGGSGDGGGSRGGSGVGSGDGGGGRGGSGGGSGDGGGSRGGSDHDCMSNCEGGLERAGRFFDGSDSGSGNR